MRPGGRVVVIGLEVGTAEINTSHVMLMSVQLHGSLGASKQDLIEIYDLIAAGDLQPTIEEVDFDDVPAATRRRRRDGGRISLAGAASGAAAKHDFVETGHPLGRVIINPS